MGGGPERVGQLGRLDACGPQAEHNEKWLNKKYPFYGGQQVNKVYADINSVVDKGWEWDPIHEFVATQGDAANGKSVEQGKGYTAALQPWQDSIVKYAEQQGLKVAK